MKLSDWARANGVHPKTAYRLWRNGTLPVPARQINAGVERQPAVAIFGDARGHEFRPCAHQHRRSTGLHRKGQRCYRKFDPLSAFRVRQVAFVDDPQTFQCERGLKRQLVF